MWIWAKSVYTHLPKDQNCEICQRTKITRAPCRRRVGGAVPRAEKFGDLIKADNKIMWKLWISNQSPICSRGAGLGHSMDPVVSVQKETGNQRSLQKFLEPDRKPKVSYTDNESLHVYTSQIGDQWNCWKSSAQSKGRYLCCIVAIGSKWKLVGRFHGMLHLSAKRHRSVIWWEDALWKTLWATI